MRIGKFHFFEVAALVLALGGSALAARSGARLILKSSVLPRIGETPVTIQLPQGFTGKAAVHLIWSDSLGRVVADKTLPFDMDDETEIVFPINLSKAVAMQNHLEADVSLNGKDIKGQPYVEQAKAEADFVSTPPFTGWKDYVVFMWQPYQSTQIPALKQLGINAGVYSSRDFELPNFLIDTNTRWYADQLAVDYWGSYHRWYPDRDTDWVFTQTKKLYEEHPNSLAAFKRYPSFEDPYWVRKIHDRAVDTVKRLAPYRPYFYNLGDEIGISVMGTGWDFDMSDMSIVPMRRWLKKQYGSLGALNKEWGTDFTDWNLVMPETTTQAMARPGDNFAPWADFKEWMDISFARSLKMGTDAIQSVDPQAYVGITGSQMPSLGGTDYALLTKAVNVIEAEQGAMDIVHTLNPNVVLVNTANTKIPEKRRVWHKLLQGDRGMVIWDAKHNFVEKDGQPGPEGIDAGKFYKEICDGEGALIINSRPVDNLININYSQPSLRTQWMLQMRPLGKKWATLAPDTKSAYGDGNPFAWLRISWVDLLEDLGFQPDFIASAQMTNGGLMNRDSRVLVLPESSSLSQEESDAIRQFVKEGGIVIASGMPGTYDQHSKKLPQSSLADVFGGPAAGAANVRTYGKGKAILLGADIEKYLEQRVHGTADPTHKLIGDLLRSNGVHPPFTITGENGRSPIGIELRIYANGGVRILALDSSPQQPRNLKLMGLPNVLNERFSHPVTVHLHLPHAMYVYDTRARKALGQHKELTLTVDPEEPTILAASDTPLPEMQVSVPDQAQRGSIVDIAVHALPAQANTSVYHVEVRNSQGKEMVFYSGNIIANSGGVRSIPLAKNDPAGTWTVAVRDVMSGQTITRNLEVR
jgi:hypothetical protein